MSRTTTQYVRVQAEAAVRHLASSYAYDEGENEGSDEPTLRASQDRVTQALVRELADRLDQAGIAVEDAKLTHLAYAPEIAQVMLRRQQAEAIIAARSKIVHGAVSMVEMALKGLSDRDIVHLDDERRAAMVSNLLVVLCSESDAQPVINTGHALSVAPLVEPPALARHESGTAVGAPARRHSGAAARGTFRRLRLAPARACDRAGRGRRLGGDVRCACFRA